MPAELTLKLMDIHPVTLVGRFIRLEPLALEHVPDLARVGTDPQIWQYMLYGEIHSQAEVTSWVEDMLERQAQGADLPFAVVLQSTGRAIGATRYMSIRAEHRGLEIGGTWYGVEYQGSGVNADAKFLLLSFAFERLNAVRVQLKTDARNLRSQRAIEKLGATKEGILRRHMLLLDGTLRDSVMYSIIDSEWPEVKARLKARLDALFPAG